MEINRKFALTTASSALMVTLIAFASGLVSIQPPEQQLGGPGFVYTVEYECGKLESADRNPQAQLGQYATNIIVHNPFTQTANVFIKVLPATGLPDTSLWLNTEAVTIAPDGALEINCSDITGLNPTVPPFSKGLVTISHPVTVEDNIVIKQPVFEDESLDVVASYTYLASSVEEAEDTFFNKIIVKVKERKEDGTVTFKLHEVIIPAKLGEPITDLRSKILQELKKGGIDVGSGSLKIAEIVSIDFAIGGGGTDSGIGASKDVETVKGKFVPFVPLPPPTTPTTPTTPADGDP